MRGEENRWKTLEKMLPLNSQSRDKRAGRRGNEVQCERKERPGVRLWLTLAASQLLGRLLRPPHPPPPAVLMNSLRPSKQLMH